MENKNQNNDHQINPEQKEAFKINFSQTARKVLEKRYLKKDEKGFVIETPEDMLKRVANNISLADRIYNPEADIKKTASEFYSLMANLEFLPNTPTLINAGRELQQLSACFVLPVEDSMDSIFDAVKNTAIIHKSGGGTGFSFNRLRPKNDRVSTTGGIASGPLSFMNVFNSATEVVKQGGTRRGANMAILNIDHPDIVDFINCKMDKTKLTNFNISVAITEEFMKMVENNQEMPLRNPRSGDTCGSIPARKLFNLIAEKSWESGEPGIVFIDRMNRDNPTPLVGKIESTNPCGEQPLLPYESCNLGSINLSKMIKFDGLFYVVDYEKLEKTVKIAVHFLDNVVDMNAYPLKEIEKLTRANRKIGLGIMGFADMLINLGIPYDTAEALTIGEEIMSFITQKAMEASYDLADERGAFMNFKGSIYDKPGRRPLRNATLTTIAPTGTLSIIAGCSGGIEPYFALSYMREILGGEKFVETIGIFEEYAKNNGFYSEGLMEEIAKKGTIQEFYQIPENVRRLFATSHDISPLWHVRMQAIFQRHTHNAVSKTVNLPETATIDDIKEIMWLSYKEGCKGVTVYRSGSRDSQVLNVGNGTSHNSNTNNNNNPNNDMSKFNPTSFDIDELIKKHLASASKDRSAERGHILLPDAKAAIDSLKKAFKWSEKTRVGSKLKCPECSNLIEYVGGCVICRFCGHSMCS